MRPAIIDPEPSAAADQLRYQLAVLHGIVPGLLRHLQGRCAGILATIAKQERVRLSERTTAGLERARKQGPVGGRPPVVFDQAKVERLHKAGKSLTQIAAAVGTSKSTVHRPVMAAGGR